VASKYQVGVHLSQYESEELDRLCAKTGETRATYLRRLLEQASDYRGMLTCRLRPGETVGLYEHSGEMCEHCEAEESAYRVAMRVNDEGPLSVTHVCLSCLPGSVERLREQLRTRR
jgi:hypothetical protein